MKIAALCCFRNASLDLPEFVSHLEPYVDQFLFLDDRSNPSESHEARGILGECPKATTLINRAARTGGPFQFEVRNRQLLLSEAIADGCDWGLCLNVDERIELQFLKDLQGICEGATCNAYSVMLRDLWDSKSQYRVDGIWATKRREVLYRLSVAYKDVPEGLHKPWVHVPEPHAELGYNLYHLGSLTAGMRFDRVRRQEIADPENKFQADYKYLADETGLKLEAIPEGRGWK